MALGLPPHHPLPAGRLAALAASFGLEPEAVRRPCLTSASPMPSTP